MTKQATTRLLRRPWEALSRNWNSVAFRLTLNYGLLTILTSLILLLVIYTQVVGVLRTQQSNQIHHAEQRLASLFQTGGVGAVAHAIDLAIADELDGGEDLYLLKDPLGRRVAGNMEVPQGFTAYSGLFEMSVDLDDRQARGYFRRQVLPDDHILLVGHEAGRIDRATAMILQGIGATVALAIVLVVSGAFLFRREFEKRVGPLRTTARQIGPGKLSLRVPQSHESDEFSHLNHDVNAMLDRIEKLMTGVRHVSDTIAHDLRTPLMRIQGRLRSVQQTQATRADLMKVVDGVAEEIDRVNGLLGKLLQISELEAGVGRKAFSSCRLDLIAADVVDLYSALAEDQQIDLRLHAPLPALIQGDEQLLANACANILDNALKYAAGTIHVSVDTRADGVFLKIEDDGPGIDEADQKRLGERFYRPDTSRDGWGLGLASVKAIISLHNGKLTFTHRNSELESTGLVVQAIFPDAG